MSVVRGIVVGLIGAALMLTVAASQSTPASGALSTVSATSMPESSGEVVWGKVPYCSCLIDSATANVATALKEANLTVSLQEQSPHDGWLYFVVTFDPQVATVDQVSTAMVAGGAEVLAGPP